MSRASMIFGLMLHDYKIFLSTHWRLLELLYFPITTIIIWGLFAVWTNELASSAGMIALAVNIFWSWAYTVQSTANIAMNEDAWSGEAAEVFATGMSKWEYMGARIMLAVTLSVLNMFIVAAISQAFGFFDFVELFAPTLALAGTVFMASIGIAMIVAGIFFAVGIEHTWLAFSAMQFFVLLSSPLSPPAMLPAVFQSVASVMPFTALFEGVRALVTGQPWLAFVQTAALVGLVYLAIGLVCYHFGFERARRTGQLARAV